MKFPELMMPDQEMIQEKIGEAIGSEKAAQVAVETLESRGLLKAEHMNRLAKMKEQASDQEEKMQKSVDELVESDGFGVGLDQQLSRNRTSNTIWTAEYIPFFYYWIEF
jgi:hypothetical protein